MLLSILINRLFSTVNVLFFAGAFCYWVSLQAIGLWFLVFLVPVFWTLVMEHPQQIRLRTIYFGAFLFWAAFAWWFVWPHRLVLLGLMTLAGYLAIYWCLFFSASRIAVCRFRLPVVFAFPVCWIGCEYLRNHLLDSIPPFNSLEYALYCQPLLIQIADIGGGYLVGGMIMLIGSGVAVGINSLRTHNSSVYRYVWSSFAGLIFVAAIGYGFVKTAEIRVNKSNLTIAALQGNIPAQFGEGSNQANRIFTQYIALVNIAVKNAQTAKQPLDLIVFPETVCSIYLLKYNSDLKPTEFDHWTKEHVEYWDDKIGQLRIFVNRLGVPVLAGLSRLEFETPPEPKRFNSALLIDPKNDRSEYRYDKMRLFMFGEYLPFSQYLPKNFFLKKICQDIEGGTKPVAFPLRDGQLFFSVNICVESMLPSFVRNQILTLKKQGKEPAILISMSNDGWFLFSPQIDQHLATHVFRAVENRRPYIAATNDGFSAIIDRNGMIQKIGQRRQAEIVVGSVSVTDCESPIYHRIGDLPAIACMLGVFVLFFTGWYKNRQNRNKIL
jgi:apolipoprotein N-acyltransferase